MSLYLGLPQWSHPAWPGQLLGVGAKPADAAAFAEAEKALMAVLAPL